ncbi:hypothetical protein JTE90_015237 [Oedothorax gibbosus]|uniref:Uncharacterized protein n=1 Tax=Oedothorax gibbosus TaxID=931172 RepID=A0AAV6TZZ5_9ARAC|nr:hypothetical protein JTE90_015237 [Oedothorax gibbosus]
MLTGSRQHILKIHCWRTNDNGSFSSIAYCTRPSPPSWVEKGKYLVEAFDDKTEISSGLKGVVGVKSSEVSFIKECYWC